LNTNYKWLKKLNPWLRKNNITLTDGESLYIEVPVAKSDEITVSD
jgi:hypothetical protein